MNKFIISILMIFVATGLAAQREVIIEPERVGILNDIILGDTVDGGERVDPNTIYILKRGGVYKTTSEIRNPGYALSIRAEVGTGPMPIIMPTAATGGQSLRPFTVQGDFNLDGVYVTCYNDLGGFQDRIMRVNIADVRISLTNCWFDGTGQSVVRFDTEGGKIYMENCIVSHAGNAFNPNNGRVVDFRQNGDTIVLRNNTIYNLTARMMRVSGGFNVKYAEFQYNTMINSGQIIADMEQTLQGRVQDNLFINAGFNGTSRGGQLIQYNPLSLAAKALYDGLGVSQNISIYNNWFYYQPGVRYVWADSLMEQPFYDPEMFPFLIDPNGDPMDSATLYEDYTFQGEIELKNAPRLSEAVQRGMIFDQLFAESLDNGSSPNWDFTQSWFFQLIDGNLPEDRSLPYDFSYSSSETAATAAIDGGPVGDRSWELEDFNIVVGTDFRIQNELFYPNPVSSTITFYPQRKIAAVVIFDMKGQRIMRSEVWDSQLDLTDLQKGAYIASLVDSNGNRFNKILLKK